MNVLTLWRTHEVFVDEGGGDVWRQTNWNFVCLGLGSLYKLYCLWQKFNVKTMDLTCTMMSSNHPVLGIVIKVKIFDSYSLCSLEIGTLALFDSGK